LVVHIFQGDQSIPRIRKHALKIEHLLVAHLQTLLCKALMDNQTRKYTSNLLF